MKKQIDINTNGLPVTVRVDGKPYEQAEYAKGGYVNSAQINITTNNRMRVLRGEWQPTDWYSEYYVLKRDYPYFVSNNPSGEVCAVAFPLKNPPFFPTRELGNEFLLIEKGKWLPKKGDRLWRTDPSYVGEQVAGCDYQEYARLGGEMYFPSEKQRQAYIDKHRKRLPTVAELHEYRRNYNGITVNDFGTDEPMLKYTKASVRSRLYANKIREAERSTGNPLEFGLFKKAYRLSDSGVLEIPVSPSVISGAAPGIEYFATYDGAELYQAAMGDDLKYLLCNFTR